MCLIVEFCLKIAAESTEEGSEEREPTEAGSREEEAAYNTSSPVCATELHSRACSERLQRWCEWCNIPAF